MADKKLEDLKVGDFVMDMHDWWSDSARVLTRLGARVVTHLKLEGVTVGHEVIQLLWKDQADKAWADPSLARRLYCNKNLHVVCIDHLDDQVICAYSYDARRMGFVVLAKASE